MQDILAPLYVDLMSKVHNILTTSTHASIQQQVFSYSSHFEIKFNEDLLFDIRLSYLFCRGV